MMLHVKKSKRRVGMWIVYVEVPGIYEEVWEGESQHAGILFCRGFLAHHNITF